MSIVMFFTIAPADLQNYISESVRLKDLHRILFEFKKTIPLEKNKGTIFFYQIENQII